MEKSDYEKLEGLLVKAVQSTKQETSGLVSDIKKDIAELKSNYSKREIDHFMSEIKENTVKILEQTTKHNARMIKIESELGMGTDEPTKISTLTKTVDSLKTDRTKIWTVVSLIAFLGASLGGLFMYGFKSYVKELAKEVATEVLQDNVSAIYYEK